MAGIQQGRTAITVRPCCMRRLSKIEVDKLDIVKIAGDDVVPFDFIEKDVVDPDAEQNPAAFGQGIAAHQEFYGYPAPNLGTEKPI